MEAIAEVRKQLAKFPNDFAGWMLLAEIHAEDLKDLLSARQTVENILGQQPPHAPKNIAFALTRMADWELKFRQDPEAARAALERIVDLLPDTEQAQIALQRIAHLAPAEMLAERRAPRRISVPQGTDHLGLRDQTPDIKPPEEAPEATAARLASHLDQFPYDNEAREQLALIYARHYRRLDLATDQLEQLISLPNQPAKQVVHWLNILADIQVEIIGDTSQARQTLQRIIDRFPGTAAAENATNRIAYLNLELRPKQQRQAIKLGSYEDNIGLKHGPFSADAAAKEK